MKTDGARPAIRLGIDFGTTACRVAYLHPGAERAVVPVPLSLEQVRPCFPIVERLSNNDLYTSRFFPGVLQRLLPDFRLTLRGEIRRTRDVVAELIQKAIREGENFAGRPVEAVVLGAHLGIDGDAREAFREALRATGLPGALSSDAEAACACFRATEMREGEHATVLVFSAGYMGLGVAAGRITPRGVRVLAKAADQGVLAGNVLDFTIMQATVRCLEEARILLTDTAHAWAPWSALLDAAETAKRDVQDGKEVVFRVPEALVGGTPGPVRVKLMGPVFREVVRTHMDRALELVAGVLDDTGVKDSELGYVLLVGGTTHLPDVVQGVQARFGADKVRHLPPDAVAGGAALLAAAAASPADLGGDAFPVAGPFLFQPDPLATRRPGLVVLASETSAPPAGGPPARRPAELPAPVDTLTLAAIQARLDAGERAEARSELTRLAEAVRRKLEMLDRSEAK
jgi:molecular chaperone DnaK (HSP70)